jgi:hypothetical protein
MAKARPKKSRRRRRLRFVRRACGIFILAGSYSTMGWAYWTAVPTATVTVVAGSTEGVSASVVLRVDPAHQLVPGGSIPIELNIHNPNALPVILTEVSISALAVSVDHIGCSASSVGTPNLLPLIAAPSIAPGSDLSVSFTAQMLATAESLCQGATFSFETTIATRQ